MIAILDYGVGNLFSLRSSLSCLGLESKLTADPGELRAADRIILPGVGAFGDAMDKLKDTGLVPLIRKAASTDGMRAWASSRAGSPRWQRIWRTSA